jgi:hypothetical protein
MTNQTHQVIERLFRAMDQEEKQDCIRLIGELAIEYKIVEDPSKAKTSGGKRKRRIATGASAKPYWMRKATGVDKSAKGMFQIEGEWVNDIAKDCEFGDVIVVGVKGDNKHYYLCTRENGESTTIDIGGAKTTIEDVKLIRDSKRFGELLGSIEYCLK